MKGEREGEGWRKRGRRQGGWEEGKLGVELHLKVGDMTTESSRGSFEERSTEPCQCPIGNLNVPCLEALRVDDIQVVLTGLGGYGRH